MATAPGTRQSSRPWARLRTGCDSLTLTPAPTLRQLQQDLSRPGEQILRGAWTSVGSALAGAMRSPGQPPAAPSAADR